MEKHSRASIWGHSKIASLAKWHVLISSPRCHCLSLFYPNPLSNVIPYKVINYGMTEDNFLLYTWLLMQTTFCQKRWKKVRNHNF